MTRLLPLALALSFAIAATADASLIATADCASLSSPCNSESNVESLVGVDLYLVAEAEEGLLPGDLAFFDGDGNPVTDPFLAELTEGTWVWNGAGTIEYASLKSSGDLYVYDMNSWSFPRHGISNLKLWSTSPPIPEPSAALVFALGTCMVSVASRGRRA